MSERTRSITLVSAYFLPKPSAGANRMASFASALQASEFTSHVVVPSFGQNIMDEPPTFHRIPTDALERPRSFLLRFVYEAVVSIRLLGKAASLDTNLYLVTCPFLFCLLAAPFVIRKDRLILDVRDLVWEYDFGRGDLVRSAQRILRRWAIWSLRKASMVLVTTEAEAVYMRDVVGVKDLCVITNGVESSIVAQFNEPMADDGFDTPALVYAGTIGSAQGLSILADFALNEPGVQVKIAGHGPESVRLKNLVDTYAIDNLSLLGQLSRKETIELYKRATVLFLRLVPGFQSAIPSKLYEYAASGRPIIYMGNDGACWQILKQFECAARVEDGDVEGLSRAFGTLSTFATPSVANVARVQAEFTREVQAARLLNVIRRL